MVTPTPITRKQQFRAALHLAGTSAQRWAASQNVTTAHLNYVLNGSRRSQPLEEAIDAFIEQWRWAMASADAA